MSAATQGNLTPQRSNLCLSPFKGYPAASLMQFATHVPETK
jgi:hypothetical protein